MTKRWFARSATAALVLLLANAGISQAQFAAPWFGSIYFGPPYSRMPALSPAGAPSSVALSPARYVAYYPPLYVGSSPAPVPALGPVADAVAVAPVSYVGFDPPLFSGRSPTVAPVGRLLNEEKARIEVTLPAGAQLWFDDYQTSERGTRRSFITPALAPGQGYHYEVRARWTEEGKLIEQSRRVSVRAGARLAIVFPTPK
jgi:uncharacterized protein (TIGR03000 family)